MLLTSLLTAGSLALATAGSPAWTRIEPGPRVITEEEAALTPGADGPHAVILAEETDLRDSVATEYLPGASGAPSNLRYHLRARILANEARELANVEIPLYFEESVLVDWWGFTIHPDGTVRRLTREDLLSQQVLKVEDEVSIRVLKGLLPGVEPGVVIDYGYEVSGLPISGYREVPFQREWPVASLRYRWRPWKFAFLAGLSGACSVERSDLPNVEMSQAGGGFVLRATDLPARVEEPYMPFGRVSGGSVSFYYTFRAGSDEAFWGRFTAPAWEKEEDFLWQRHVRKALKEMGIDREGDPEEGLRRAYAWIQENMENLGVEAAEDLAGFASRGHEEQDEKLLPKVMTERRGTGDQLDMLLLGAARALGFEAFTVLASDKRRHLWDPGKYALGQLDERVIAVRLGAPGEDRWTWLDAASGLPFGQVPWWVAGTRGLQVMEEGPGFISIPAGDAASSASQTEVDLILPESEEGRARVRWTVRGKGQVGLVERRSLRRLHTEAREEKLEELCRGGGGIDLAVAESPSLDHPSEPYRLRCEGESDDAVEAWGDGKVRIRFDGPWIPEVPGFPDADRKNPIEFPFARTDVTTLVIHPPAGMRPGPLPEPVVVESPFGSYALHASEEGGSVAVRRSLRLPDRVLDAGLVHGLNAFLARVRAGDLTRLTFVAGEPAP